MQGSVNQTSVVFQGLMTESQHELSETPCVKSGNECFASKKLIPLTTNIAKKTSFWVHTFVFINVITFFLASLHECCTQTLVSWLTIHACLGRLYAVL